MDHVVCVSRGRRTRSAAAGVRARKVVVIPNAIDPIAVRPSRPAARERAPGAVLRRAGPADRRGRGPAQPGEGLRRAGRGRGRGRRAPTPTPASCSSATAPLRPELEEQIAALGLAGRFVLAGFRADLDRFDPPRSTCSCCRRTPRGMPNVVLEACAAGVPGRRHGRGRHAGDRRGRRERLAVPPGDPSALADRIRNMLGDQARQGEMGRRGQTRVRDHFTFEAQARHYLELLEGFCGASNPRRDERIGPDATCSRPAARPAMTAFSIPVRAARSTSRDR